MNAEKFFNTRGRNKETTIDLPGGKLVVPGHATTDRGLVTLVSRALRTGKARVKPPPKGS